MTSIERTAYPQFRRLTSARVLHVFFTPSDDEVGWARERSETTESLLALLVALKCFQKMARFCPLEEVPPPVIDHVRRSLGLAPEIEPDHGAARTLRWHKGQVRKRLGATRDMRRARALAEAAIREAALVRNHPPDLINIALERIIEASLEPPAYSTLDDMATTIRAEVNEAIFGGIVSRMGPEGRLRALGLLATAGTDGRSVFNRLKKPAQRAWSRFKAQAEYLDEVDEIGDTGHWLEGVAPSKVSDFAREAAAQDVDTLSRYGDAKKVALLACLVHMARQKARDDLAEMLCKRVASITKKAKEELDAIRVRQREVQEKLIGTYRTVLESLDPEADEPGKGPARAVAAVEDDRGFAAQLADIEEGFVARLRNAHLDAAAVLIVYRAFYGPEVTTYAEGGSYPERACVGCSFGADQVAHPGHLHARDTTLAFASRAPQAEIRRLKERHGWNHIPWYTITDDFDKDFDVDEWHGTNAFIREGDQVFRTYFIDNRGDEQMGSTWNCLDITALGRQETWEDSPEGYPQTPPYQWWNYHDAHDAAE